MARFHTGTRATWAAPGSGASPVVPHLNRTEVQAMLEAPDLAIRAGVRDRAMLHLCFASGLRVSELVTLRMASLSLHADPSLRVTRKGRRERTLPL